jgi:hypothetical protein
MCDWLKVKIRVYTVLYKKVYAILLFVFPQKGPTFDDCISFLLW